MRDFSSIAKLIKQTDKKRTEKRDIEAFNKYHKSKATLQETIRQFKINNDIKNDCYIDEQLFNEWLKSLGY